MTDSPESRRDSALVDVLEAGGVLLGEPTPMATESDPHTVAAYYLPIGAPDLASRSALADIRSQTATDLDDLIPWTPAPEPEPVYVPPVYDEDPEWVEPVIDDPEE